MQSDDLGLVERIREAARDIRNDGTPSQVGLTDQECEAVATELERLRAIVEDRLGETRLVSAGPTGKGFGFDLMGGPIPYIAEYLFQFIGARDDDKPMSNYAEIEVNHREFGAMTLTLQRHSGQTPHHLRLAAEAQRDKLKQAAATYFERYCRDEADDVENSVCGDQQHRDAIALRDALATLGDT